MNSQSFLERAAYELGKTLRAFRTGASGDDPRGLRPSFLGATAEAGKWKGGQFSGAREEAQRRAIQNSWVYTAINEKAIEISKGRLRVGWVDTVTEEAEIIQGHHFERVLRNPNPIMGRALLWQFTHWWMDLDGNSYWFIAPDEDGLPGELWPLPSNAVRVWPGDQDRIVDYFEYQANGAMYKIPAEYICHFKYPHPLDLFRGMAPLVAGMLPVDSDLAMARWNGAFFGQNNVMPSAIVNLSSGNPAAPIDPADVDAVRNELQTEYNAAARKTVVTNAYQMAVNLLGWNARDMDFLGGREATKEEIFQILGYPPGYADKSSTESNATVMYAKFMDRIYGTLKLYSEQLSTQIIDRFYHPDQQSFFDDVRPINKEQLLREADASRGDMTINERRKRFWGLKPVTWGDAPPAQTGQPGAPSAGLQDGISDTILREPVNPVNALPEAQRALAMIDLKNWRTKAVKSLKTGGRAAVKFESQHIKNDVADAIRDGLELAERPEDARQIFEQAQKGVIRSWRPWSGFEEILAATIAESLNYQAGELIRRIQENGDPGALENPAVWAQLESGLRETLEPVLTGLAMRATGRVRDALGSAGVDWGLANQQAADWTKNHAGELVRDVTETTRRAIGEELAAWSRTDEGIDGLARRIEKMTDEEGKNIFNAYRAETIAITEATNTYAGANALTWQQAGYLPAAFKPAAHPRCRCYLQPWTMADGTKVLVWYTARDERVCNQTIETPWGAVEGCGALHRAVVSEGQYLGQQVE